MMNQQPQPSILPLPDATISASLSLSSTIITTLQTLTTPPLPLSTIEPLVSSLSITRPTPPPPPLVPMNVQNNESEATSDSDSDNEDRQPDWEALSLALSPDALEALKGTMDSMRSDATDINTSTNEENDNNTNIANNKTIEGEEDDNDKIGTKNYHPPLPSSNKAYGTQTYWEERFKVEDSFDWLVTWSDVSEQIEATMRSHFGVDHFVAGELRVLVVGCGNSPFSVGMYSSGFTNIESIDYSQVVIDSMSSKYSAVDYPGMKWTLQDMTVMDAYADNSFDIVIDKAAMDALMVGVSDVWNPDGEVISKCYKMCRQIRRIMDDVKGIHLQVSFEQPHFRTKFLTGKHLEFEFDSDGDADEINKETKIEVDKHGLKGFGWTCEVETIAGKANDGCFHHFLYVMPVTVNSGTKC